MLFNETSQTPNPIVVIIIAAGLSLLFVGLEYIRFRIKVRAFRRHMDNTYGPLSKPSAEMQSMSQHQDNSTKLERDEYRQRMDEINDYDLKRADRLAAIDRAYGDQLRDAQDQWDKEHNQHQDRP